MRKRLLAAATATLLSLGLVSPSMAATPVRSPLPGVPTGAATIAAAMKSLVPSAAKAPVSEEVNIQGSIFSGPNGLTPAELIDSPINANPIGATQGPSGAAYTALKQALNRYNYAGIPKSTPTH